MEERRPGNDSSMEVKGWVEHDVSDSLLNVLLSEERHFRKGSSDVLIDALFELPIHKILMPRALCVCVLCA